MAEHDEFRNCLVEEFRHSGTDVFAFLSEHPDAAPDERCDVLIAALRGNPASGLTAEDYLSRCPDVAAQPSLKLLLVVAEFQARLERGDRPDLAAYLTRFPDLGTQLERLFSETILPPGCDGESAETVLRAPHDTADASLSELLSADTGRLAPGAIFGGYVIEQEIARGGMGVVFRARQVALNRPVALKMILSAHLASRVEVERFHSEAQSAARLDHPGIVPIYEVGSVNGQNFFSMALVEGGALSSVLKDGPLAGSAAAQHVKSIAEAVQYAHSRNIVHRDLKPANVLLDRQGRPIVSDFGLAKNIERDSGLTATGAVMGTPAYMAPEQAAGRQNEVGPLADVYALGGILYFLLTGQPPFAGSGPFDVIDQVLHREPSPPRQHNPRVDLDLSTICLKCLEKDPARRYSSAGELGDELQRYLEGMPIAARPVGALERSGRWCRRNPASAGLVAALAVLVMGGFSAALWYVSDRAEREADRIRRNAETERRVADLQREIESNLQEARAVIDAGWTMLERPEEWGQSLAIARTALRRADALVTGSRDPVESRLAELLEQLDGELTAAEAGQTFALEFDQLRLRTADFDAETQGFRNQDTVSDIARGLAAYAFEIGAIPAEQAVTVLHGKPPGMLPVVIDALDMCVQYGGGGSEGRTWVQAVLEQIDPDEWRRGVRAAAARDVEEMCRLADECDVARQPVSTVLMLAYALHGNNRHRESADLLERAWHQWPDDLWINNLLGWLSIWGEEPDGDAALRHFSVALARRPASAILWVRLGEAYRMTGDHDLAAAAYEKALALQPDYAGAHLSSFTLHTEIGDAATAQQELERAVAIQPDLAYARAVRGWSHSRQEQWDEAVGDFRRAVEQEPRNADYRNRLAYALRMQGDHAASVDEYLEAIRLAPESPSYMHSLGVTLYVMGNLPGAEAVFRWSMERHPSAWDSYSSLAVMLFEQDRAAEGLEYSRRAVELAPEDADAWLTHAGNLLETQQYEAAAAAARRSLELEPDSASAFHNLGVALFHLNDPAAALEAFRSAKRLGVQNTRLHLFLGRCLLAVGDRKQALVEFRTSAERNPYSPESLTALADLLKETGNVEGAKMLYAGRDELLAILAESQPPVRKQYGLLFDAAGQFVETPVSIPPDGTFTLELLTTPLELPPSGVHSALIGSPVQIKIAPNGNWEFLGVADTGAPPDAQPQYLVCNSRLPALARRPVHLAAVVTPERMLFFVNGIPAARREITQPLLTGAPVDIGWRHQSANFSPYHGTLSQVRISGSARYTESFVPPESFEPDEPTLALYEFDEGDGDVLQDSSGNERHATIHGATWIELSSSAVPDR